MLDRNIIGLNYVVKYVKLSNHIMRKIRLVLVILVGLSLLIGIIFFLIGYFKPKVAGMYIETNPSATVFIDGAQVGRTPYRATLNSKEIVIKLIPDSFQVPLAPYETRVGLVTGVETVIKRDFGELEETSSGEIISFEKVAKDETSLVIISVPDAARLYIDDKDVGYAPYKTSSISSGEHGISLSAEGFLKREVRVKTHQGFKLTAIVKLGKDENKIAEKEEILAETEESLPKDDVTKVRISSTPTGFLRVRSDPSTLSEEVGKVEPGEDYNLLETDQKTGWFKIEFEEGKKGWISNQYAKKVEKDGASTSPTPSPTGKLSPTPKL